MTRNETEIWLHNPQKYELFVSEARTAVCVQQTWASSQILLYLSEHLLSITHDLHTPFLWKNHPHLKLSVNHLQVCLYLLHGGGDSANNSLARQKIQSNNTISKFIYQKKCPHCSYFVQVKKNFLCLLVVTTVFIIDTEFLFLQKQKETLFTTCHFDFF